MLRVNKEQSQDRQRVGGSEPIEPNAKQPADLAIKTDSIKFD